MSLLPIALQYLHNGISVIPCNTQTKAPRINTWKRYATSLPRASEMVAWFKRGDAPSGIAAIGGKVSGGLEIIDFDAPSLFPEWESEVSKQDNGLLNKLVISQTQRGGFHAYYRSPAITSTNKKLARDESGKTLIETRANGGYVIAPPSPKYNWIHQNIDVLPHLSMRERFILLSAAISFDRTPPIIYQQPPEVESIKQKRDGLRPGDLYNLYGDVHTLLLKNGWTYLYNRGEQEFWCRPGKSEGVSATFNYAGRNLFYVFSNNAYPLEANRAYTPFALYTFLECGGNFRYAAGALVAAGFVAETK